MKYECLALIALLAACETTGGQRAPTSSKADVAADAGNGDGATVGSGPDSTKSEDAGGDTEPGLGPDVWDAGDSGLDTGDGDAPDTAADVAEAVTDAASAADTDVIDVATDTMEDIVPGDAAADALADVLDAPSGTVDSGVADADAAAPVDVLSEDVGPILYTGPGYPTALPELIPPEATKGAGGLSQCDQEIPIPSGAGAPGPCITIGYIENGKVPNFMFHGYDCVPRQRVTREYCTKWPAYIESHLCVETYFDWTEDGLPVKKEALWKSGRVLDTWEYYDDGLLKKHFWLNEDYPITSYYESLERTMEFEYVLSEEGLLLAKTLHGIEADYVKGKLYAYFEYWVKYEYTYDETGRMVKDQAYTKYGSSDEFGKAGYTLYEYNADGTMSHAWDMTWNDLPADARRYTYVPFEDKMLMRTELMPKGEKEFSPDEEHMYDSEGRLLMYRLDLHETSKPEACPYGPCWGFAEAALTYVYDAAGRLVQRLAWGNDTTLLGLPGTVTLWEYDEFGRLVGEGLWGSKPQKYSFNGGWRYHFDCWDTGSAVSGKMEP